ncbi:hypothetical protein [Nonomuraea sp. NPDC049784]|uniref:hypothetical protein n=1 Tax=Nonomuraea sp. NPDC049784 TaxID=3154361 RepID=UPI0033EDF898
MSEGAFEEVTVLWEEHQHIPFPSLGDRDLFADLVMADDGATGVVNWYVRNDGGVVSAQLRRQLGSSVRELRRIRRRVRTREGKLYVDRLLRMAGLILGRGAADERYKR